MAQSLEGTLPQARQEITDRFGLCIEGIDHCLEKDQWFSQELLEEITTYLKQCIVSYALELNAQIQAPSLK